MPKVSVVIPTHNPNEIYLREALDSVFRQTYQDFEVIVVDDGSSVDTKKMLSPYGNRIHYFYKDNCGANTARLLGLKKAQGEYIALNDDDDIWVPDKLQKQVEFLDACPELDLIFSDFIEFSAEDFSANSALSLNQMLHAIPNEIAPRLSFEARLFKHNIMYGYLKEPFIIQCTLMARKKACEKYRIFETKMRVREFFEFALRELHLLKIGFIDEILAHHRIHPDNSTGNYELFRQNTLFICNNALDYPWMDKCCREILLFKIFRSYVGLGIYYIFLGKFSEGRKNLQAIVKDNRFHIASIARWACELISSKNIIQFGRYVKRWPKSFSKNEN